jgi:hypothetical protein
MKLNIAILALSLGASSAFASDAARQTAAQTIPLKDGGILYMFKEGSSQKTENKAR